VSATFAGLRPATEHRDYALDVDRGQRWITVAGIRSTGLSAALGLGEWAADNGSAMLGEKRPEPPDDDLDWPVMPNLSETSQRAYELAGRSPIVCHCEWVTEAEVTGALAAPPPGTLGGLKRRTRVMMGRCQGFGCAAAVQRIAPELFAGQSA
jgi:glycerol-3-phosphate dehydrogenase